ncbi:MAG: AmmeMemoRadiSam system radical SAM enzyme [Desulfofustis sp.]|nr:AmmeMemoRadiSam system radical SAM enzyme [Desulfofustis sp.]
MKTACFYQSAADGSVSCGLCAHQCTIKPGRRGICGVRENRGGELYSLVYGQVAAEHIDPVEKKPLFHFLPGSLTYSVATVGCNFRCLHCQNYTLSQLSGSVDDLPHRYREPAAIVDQAVATGCRSISYTYSEPTVFFEFAYDCCRAARQKGLHNIFVSNGYMSRPAAQLLAEVLGAINIDIKSFSDDFYRTICGGRLQPVLDNVRFFREQGVWVEATTLIIPGLNDTDAELRSIAEFLVSCDPNIPWHVSGFHPTFKMLDRPSTSAQRLLTARDLGLAAGLNYVYVGNIRGSGGEATLCPACSRVLVERSGFLVNANHLIDGRCPQCQQPVAGIWN